MKLPKTAHTSRPWRIHQIAPDFVVEDVWELPTPGGPDDFPRLLRLFTPDSQTHQFTGVTGKLFAIRWNLGKIFGWDRPEKGVGSRVPSLRERLPADLNAGPAGPDLPQGLFRSVYLTDDEWVSELASGTTHAVRHISWVPDGSGGYRGQMAVLVKPNGWFGKAYMAAIAPLRNTLVYKSLLRQMENGWRDDTPHTEHS